MKKLFTKSALLIFLMILSNFSKISAQPGEGISFRFSNVGAPIAFTGPVIPTAFTTTDDFGVAIAPPGMNIKFGGRTYQQFVVSTNGWLALTNGGAIPPAISGGGFLSNNSLSTYLGGFPLLAPFWDDLASTSYSYVYAAGVLEVQWLARIDKTNAAAAKLFWVRLNGNTGVINFCYSNNLAYTISGTPSASIGIAGVCPGDYYSISAGEAMDSTAETSNLSLRPNNKLYTFTPYQWYDNCAVAKDLGTVGVACAPTLATINNATTSGSTICSTTDVADIWFKIVKPAGISDVLVTTSPASCQTVSGTSVEIFSVCGIPIAGSCALTGSSANFGEVTVSRGTCVAETLFVRVTADADSGGKFNICIKQGIAAGSLGSTCSNPQWICGPLPYNSGPRNTAGSGSDYDETSAVCHSPYMNGEDYVFAYTPVANGCIKVDLTSVGGVRPGVFLYSGCPSSVGSYCLGAAEMPARTSISAISLVAGQTYYIVVDNDTSLGNLNNPFSIVVSAVGAPAAYDACASATDLGPVNSGITCVEQTFSTSCSTPTPIGQAVFPSCAPLVPTSTFNDGVTGDVWLKFTASFTGSLQINTDTSLVNSTSNAAMAIYTGVCGAMNTLVACDFNSGPNGMPSISISVTNTTTYFIRIWSEHPMNEGNFDICFTSSCSPPNDLPCNAINVPIGQSVAGFNTCATDVPASEPGNAAGCAAGAGTKNTVWYKATVPASGKIRVKVAVGTLTNTIIEGFIFPTGCATATTSPQRLGCNNIGQGCGTASSSGSEFTYSGLTPGATFYIALDGQGSLTGTFDIAFIDGETTVFPPIPVQDCEAAQVICSSADVVVSQPGFIGFGNVCDNGASNPCTSRGENNSSWYQFTVDPAATGGTSTISFDITPFGTNEDIDFTLWNVTNHPNSCTTLGSISFPDSLRTCNDVGGTSATGLRPTGSGEPDPYGPSVIVTGPPQTFILFINNYLNTPSGYTLHFAFPITSASSASWSGSIDTTYGQLLNWGACGPIPSCGIDAQILPTANGRQPTISAGVQSVRNLTISLGATLELLAGATLDVCGNFQNNGNLICQAGSTIRFIGTGVQQVSGFLTGINQFASLVVNKASGSVQLLNDIDVLENFTTSSNTSVFNINGKYMKVGGNFSNANGTTTFTGIGGSTVEFYNSLAQNFTNTSVTNINLNRVVMNKPLNRVTLTGVNSIMNIDSTLLLSSGLINTRSNAALEVNVKYFLPAAISGHNALSYIDGKLRRKISNGPGVTGSYDFPVGNLVFPGGYENAVIEFTTATTIPSLLATFNAWAGVPPPGPFSAECLIANYSLAPFLDNGYWTFTRSNAIFSGNYNVTLYNTGYTNNAGSFGYTVATANNLSNANAGASWGLLGVCAPGSTVDSTKRDQLNTANSDATSFNHHYGTVQTTLKLPIELLYFIAEPIGEDVLCKWETSSEINNEYFEVERSIDGKRFASIEKILGYGNGVSTESRKYSFIDNDLCEDIRYYRLKQVDINGDYTYSKPVAINCRRSSGIDLYPNPANTFIKYQFYYTENTELTANIMDISGRIVSSEKIIVQKGFNQITRKIEDLAAGVYNLRITGLEQGKVMLQKQFFKN